MASALQVAAPAKINLYLGIGARRDDGYHDVVTVMQALQVHDVVTIQPAGRLEVVCEPDLGLPAERNLAALAARTLAEAAGREPDVSVRIDKRIPVGAGLGGGSSDAAAVLVGMAELWGFGPDDQRLLEAARRVGVDVAFFLVGGTALLSGRGDVLARRLPTPDLAVALVNPGVPLPTGAVYAAFDRQLRSMPPGADAMLSALDRGSSEAVGGALHNDLAEAAIGLAAEVGDAVALLDAAPCVLGSAVAGSGSTAFGVFEDMEAALGAVEKASSRGWWAVATLATATGASIIGRAEV